MYELLIGAIVVLILALFMRERFNDPFGYGQELLNINFLPFGFKEDTCPPGWENDAGLCYPKCEAGYHGVGPACWANSVSIGVGTPIGLEPVPAGWINDGLTAREPITGGGCRTHCDGNWSWSDGGFCHTKCDPIVGGRVIGRLDHGGVCDGTAPGGADHNEKIDGLCYKKCPADLPVHIPGMPYLCYKGGPLSKGRCNSGDKRLCPAVPTILRLANKYNPF